MKDLSGLSAWRSGCRISKLAESLLNVGRSKAQLREAWFGRDRLRETQETLLIGKQLLVLRPIRIQPIGRSFDLFFALQIFTD
jgi:hypothetical protein